MFPNRISRYILIHIKRANNTNTVINIVFIYLNRNIT